MGAKQRSELVMSIQSVVIELEDREKARLRATLPVARASLSRRIRVSPSALRNLRRGRVKEPRKSVQDRINEALVHVLQEEMQAIQHRIEMLLSEGSRPDSDEILEAQKLLAQARQIIRM